eukprot:gene4282-5837_t
MSNAERGLGVPQKEVSELMHGLSLNKEMDKNGGKAPIPVRQSLYGDSNDQNHNNISGGDHDVVTEISAQDRRELKSDTFHFDAQRMIGHGSFGAVFLAKVVETDEMVAIKKVLQDKRFKNRELQIMRQLVAQPHPFIVALKQHFVTKGSKNDDQYLNLVLEYIPETIYSVAKYFIKRKETMPIFSIKIYMYQLARALAHIHGI